MTSNAASRAAPARPWRETFLVLGADAIYVVLAFLAVDAAFLRVDAGLPFSTYLAAEAALVTLMVAVEATVRKLLRRPSRWSQPLVLAAEAAAFVVLFAVLPVRFVLLDIDKGFSNLWYPMEWHRFWLNLVLVLRASPAFGPLYIACLVLLVRLKITGRPSGRVTATLAVAAYTGFLAWNGLRLVDSEERSLVSFALPMIPVLLVSPFPMWRGYSRGLIGCTLVTFLGVFYFGLVPIRFWTGEPEHPPYLERVYPTEIGEWGFPLMFNRVMELGEGDREIFLSYGATCGIAHMDAEAGTLEGIAHVRGMMRRIQMSPDHQRIYGLDELFSDFHIFSTDPLERVSSFDLFGADGLVSPFWFDVTEHGTEPLVADLFIVAYEKTEVLAYELREDQLTLRKRLDLKEAGVTAFSSGGIWIEHDEESDTLLVLIGMVDIAKHYALVELDARSLEVKRTLELPFASLQYTYLPEKRAIFTSNFYGTEILEIDRDRFEIRRRLDGPVSSRALVHDASRGLLFAGGYGSGHLDVFDDASGERLLRLSVAPKTASLTLAHDGDALFIASGFGVYRLDLVALERELRPDPMAREH